MKRWIILIVSVIALSGIASFLTLNVSNSQPEAIAPAVVERKGPQPKVQIVGAPIYDFGTMSQMKKNSHVWEVKNVGEADLQMWMEESTCSCTIGKLALLPESAAKERPRVHVKPQETTPVELEWDTKQFPSSSYSQAVTIGTNDPAMPKFKLTIKGLVYPPVQIYPPEMITMNAINNEEVARAAIAVYSMDMPTMKITKTSTGRPKLFVTKQTPLTKSDREQLHIPGGGYRVDVEVQPGLPLGRFSDTLVIETDHPSQKELKVSIRGFATGPISVVPERLGMTVSGTSGGTHSLNVLVRGGNEVNFTVEQKPRDDLLVTIARNEDPKQKGRYRLTVAVPPGTPPGHIDRDIIIKTDHPRASEIKISVDIKITK
jgi:hypothetical protein